MCDSPDGNLSARGSPGGTLSRQGMLQDGHRRRLINDRSRRSGGPTRRVQGLLGTDRCQPLVNETHRHIDTGGEIHGHRFGVVRRRAGNPREGQGQPHVDNAGVQVGADSRQSIGKRGISGQSHLGDREYPPRIAARHTDAD